MKPFVFFPFTLFLVVGSLLLLVFLFFLIQIGLISYTYERLGISAQLVFPLLLLSLLGSSINIPITQIDGGPAPARQVVQFFGMRYVIPTLEYRPTIL
ncbi:MAG TPA: hypothetical protein VNN62_06220, partial [Methylomirabilota bacterium]|nr:hypothetical protein [Methylomirabilota bacterium]